MTDVHYITKIFRHGWTLALLLALLLTGCQAALNEPVAAVPDAPVPPAAVESTATPVTAPTPTPVPAPSPAAQITQATEPLAAEEANAPTQLRIPTIGLDVAVSPMGWQVTEINGTRTTAWVLPEAGVGWHPNSARAGSVGNVVISGYQLLGDASFAPLALGDVAIGEEILLTDSEDKTFVYQVTAVSEPQPISTASTEEMALDAQYTAQGDTPMLTLITGWPDFSSTHRLFVSAEFVGMAE